MDDEVITKKKYAILRFGKIRSWGILAHVDNHNNRKVPSENLLTDIPPRELLTDGSDDFVSSARERMRELGIPEPSTRGKVLAVETVMTASRAWFESASDDQQEEWLKRCVDWVTKKFGRGLISVKLHLDEEVWHLHAVALPAVQRVPKKRGRPHKDPERRRESEAFWSDKAARWTLSYEDLLGGHRMNLSREQDDYHAAVADLGLERGEKILNVVEIELGDELSIPLPEWQRGGPRKSIPPQEYRAIIKRLHDEARAERDSIRRETAEIVKRLAALEAREAGAEAKAGQLDALERQLADRTTALDAKEQDFAQREQALRARNATAAAREKELSSARQALAEAQASVDAARKRARADEEAAATARNKAEAAEKVALEKQREATQAALDAANAKAAAETAKAGAEKTLADACAERAHESALQERQAELLARAADDATGLQITPSGETFSMNRDVMTAPEKEAYSARWAAHLIKIGRLLAQAMQRLRSLAREAEQKLAGLTRREDAVAAREAAVVKADATIAARLSAAAAAEHAAIEKSAVADRKLENATRLEKLAAVKDRQATATRILLNEEYNGQEVEREQLNGVFAKASAFLLMWAKVPISQRPAEVAETLEAGEDFMQDLARLQAFKDRGAGR